MLAQMDTRVYEKKYKRTLRDGTVKEYVCKQKYSVKENHVQMSEDLRKQILEYKALGIPATKIAKKVGLSVYRVRTVKRDERILEKLDI